MLGPLHSARFALGSGRGILAGTEGDAQSPERALTLVSESGPGFVSRALSEGALAFRTLRVQLRT